MRLIKYFLLILLSGIGIHLSIEPLYTPTALITPSHLTTFPRYIAHKSIISGDFTGNTLEAIQEALASYIDAIEIDVKSSKDNILFLYHADTLQELTNGYGKPEDYEWEYLSKLSYKGDNESKLVKLEDVFEIIGNQKFIFLDVKSDKIFNSQLAKNITSLIHKYHLQEIAVVESFNPAFLTSMRLTARDILLMYDFTIDAKASGEDIKAQFNIIPWFLKQPWIQKQIRRIIRPDVLGPRFNTNEKILKRLVDNGYPIIVWTIDDPKIAYDMFEMGIQGIQTNKPLALLEELPMNNKPVYDAGGTKAIPHEVISVKTAADVISVIEEAKQLGKSIVGAGRRHSMGGQSLLNDNLQLNMLGLNKVSYNSSTQTVTAEAGATWQKLQAILDQHNRSVMIMQSDNIFTVGGSISVNVHGWQVGMPPIATSVVGLTVITPDGKVRKISINKEAELFRAVIGGYGMFGIILSAELLTVPNTNLKFHVKYSPIKEFLTNFERYVIKNPNVELAYARLSVDRAKLFDEVGLFWYETIDNLLQENIVPESLVALKRAIFRGSQYTEAGKKLRWETEKIYAYKASRAASISRNNAMNTDIHILWPLYGSDKDILHEYFIPKEQILAFLEQLKAAVIKYNMNILNVTIREVRQDTISLLPYAKEDVFGLVCLFSQARSVKDEDKMNIFTQEVIDQAIKLGGTFYLPYRLHYNKEQLLRSYPNITEWLRIKNKWDPNKLLDSIFYQNLEAIVIKTNRL